MLFPWFEWPIFPFPAMNITGQDHTIISNYALSSGTGIGNKPRSTSWKGLPLAKTMFSPAYLNASAAVHSAATIHINNISMNRKPGYAVTTHIFMLMPIRTEKEMSPFSVGFDIANIAGLGDSESLIASSTFSEK